MLPKPCWSLSSAFVSSLRFQLLKTSGKLQLLNWSDTELPTLFRSSRFPCYRNRWISWHAPTTAAHCFSQVAKFKDLSFEEPRFCTVERWRATGLRMALSLLSTVLFGRKKWKKKVTNSWPRASASCRSCRISGSHSWPLEQWSIATASKWYWL